MGRGNFIHRVVSYVVNEVLVNGLANSPAFQRFAVRTSKKLENASKTIGNATEIAEKKKQEFAEQLKNISKNMDSFKNQ